MKIYTILIIFLITIQGHATQENLQENKAFSPLEFSIGIGLPHGGHFGISVIPHQYFYINAKINSAFWIGFQGVSIGIQQLPSNNIALRFGGGIANGYANNPNSGSSWTGYFGEIYFQKAFMNIRRLSWSLGGDLIYSERDNDDLSKPKTLRYNLAYSLKFKFL